VGNGCWGERMGCDGEVVGGVYGTTEMMMTV